MSFVWDLQAPREHNTRHFLGQASHNLAQSSISSQHQLAIHVGATVRHSCFAVDRAAVQAATASKVQTRVGRPSNISTTPRNC
eukprot:4512449-Amphidinium_carterae.1